MDGDLTTILMNLLDNAQDANQRFQSGEPR